MTRAGGLGSGAASIRPAEAVALADAVRRHCGVSVEPSKRAFLEMRVSRRLSALGCADYADYLRRLEGPGGEDERRRLVEAVTTHTTSFFREPAHYDWLAEEALPDLVAQGAGRERELVVWSAACSLGSEMWTAGMVIDRATRGPLGRLRWRLFGTDVSRAVLRRAAQAVFTEDEIAGLPEDWRRDYLLRSREPAAGRLLFRIAPELRRRAQLAWANLVEPGCGPAVMVDVAFLRNVLIYFEPDDRRAAVANVAARLAPGGFLLTGHSESLPEVPAGLTSVGPAIYRKG